MRKKPKKRNGSKAIWIGLVAALLLVVAGVVAGSVWFHSYLRSPELLRIISKATGQFAHADAAYKPLEWTGSSAFTEQVSLCGLPGSSIRSAAASQIRAEMNWRAAFGGTWKLDDLSIDRFEGEFVKPSEAAPPEEKPLPPPAGLAAFLPRRFELSQARIGSANVLFEQFRATGMRLHISPNGDGWLVEGTGGSLIAPILPTLKIASFRMRLQGHDIYLTDGVLRLGSAGKILATGETGAMQNLRATWDAVDSDDIFDSSLKRHLTGILSGNIEIHPPMPAKGKFLLRDGRMENIPILGVIADFTGNPAFRRMPLQEMSATYTYENGRLVLTDIVVESKGLLRLEGRGQHSADGQIQGQFQIGVTPQTLQWLPGSRDHVFTASRDGYLWTDIVIGGTTDHPTENLSSRLSVAMGTAIIETGASMIKNPGKAVDGAKTLMTTDPAKAVEGAKGLLNSVIGPIVP